MTQIMNIENIQMYKVKYSIKYTNDNNQNRTTFNLLYSLCVLLLYRSHYFSHTFIFISINYLNIQIVICNANHKTI